MGDRSLLVEVGDRIGTDINEGVQTLLYGLSARKLNGIIEFVPSYRSLMVVFNPLVMGRKDLQSAITEVWEDRARVTLPKTREHEIPVVYGGEYGPDLQWVADYHGLPVEAIAERHASERYRVYMIGFTPGFPYMGELPEELNTPRRETPRTHVPKGSLGIAQRQTGIYPVGSPGGWQIIGWTPINLFEPESDPPSLLQMGDWVKFKPIGPEELE